MGEGFSYFEGVSKKEFGPISREIKGIMLSEVLIDVNKVKERHLWRNTIGNDDMEAMILMW